MSKRTVEDSLPRSMWIGNIADLKRLIRICRDLESRSHQQIRVALAATEPERKADFQRIRYVPRDSDATAEWEKSEQKVLHDTIDRVKLTMELTFEKYGEKLIGDPEDLITEIDRPGDVRSVALNYGYKFPVYGVPPHSGFQVSIDKFGVSATIFGADRESIDVARPKFIDEFKAQRPWYWWMTTWWGNLVVAYVPLSILINVLFPSFVLHLSPAAAVNAWILFVASEVLLVAWATLVWPKLLPKFELIEAGSNARGRLAIGAIGSGALWIIGTVVVPLVQAGISAN